MKVVFERIELGFGSLFLFCKFESGIICNVFMWYFYFEYEIVYIFGGKGKCYIGNYFFFYEDGDLIFLGFNLFYFGFIEELLEKYVEIVV